MATITKERSMPENIVHGRKNLSMLDRVYQNNKESDYTERMEQAKDSYTYEANRNHYWLDPEFSLLYGSPLWEQASPHQKLALNHLYWICFYNYSIGGEITTMMYNQLTCGAFFHLGGYETLCCELDVETLQERIHVECFRVVGHETEKEILGKTIFSRPLPSYLDAALVHAQSKERSFVEKLPFMVNSVLIGQSPFLSTQYYVLRGLRNIQLKVKEYQHLLYGKELEKKGEFVPHPTQISHYHCLDEGFHTATSKFISHDLYKDFAAPSRFELKVANFGVNRVQQTVKTLSGAVPGIFADDSAYMPLIYDMLQTPLFGMSSAEALAMMEKCFCQDQEGFQVAAKYHHRAYTQNLEYLEGIDYLSPENRELKIMGQASVDRTLKNNIAAFRKFRQTVAA